MAGITPWGIGVLDCSGDGNPDIVTANFGNKSTTILKNSGTGSFSVNKVFSVGTAPVFVGHADLDNNGIRDIVIANKDSANVSTIRCMGNDVYAPVRTVPTADACSSVALADITGDGLVDLAVSHESSMVGLFTNKSAGTFFAPWRVDVNGGNADFHMYDFNNDGNTDMLSAHGGITATPIQFWAGTGTGTFGNPVMIEHPMIAAQTIVADFNNDGELDFAGTATTQFALTVRLGMGAGAFGPATSYLPQIMSYPIAASDLDLDGSVDVVIGHPASNPGFTVFRNDSTGLMVDPAFFQMGQNNNFDLVVGDFDNNRFPDIIMQGKAGGGTGGTLEFRMGDGWFSFKPAGSIQLPGNSTAYDIKKGDVNGDGFDDLVMTCRPNNYIATILGTGSAVFSPPAITPLNAPESTVLNDLDGDGDMDVACVTFSGSHILLTRGDGSGAMAPAGIYTGGFAAGYMIKSADLNKDGRPDLVVTSNTTNGAKGISVVLNELKNAPGSMAYGMGTIGCQGAIGMAINSSVAPGGVAGVVVSNAPPTSLGTCLVGDVPDIDGFDPSGLGLILHVDVFQSLIVNSAFPMYSDAGGTGWSEIRIPTVPGLSGMKIHAQSIWNSWEFANCGSQPFGLMSSRGLAFEIQ